MTKLVGMAIAVAAAVALAALCVYFLYIILKTMIVVPLSALANMRGPAKLTVDPQIATKTQLHQIRQRIHEIATYNPQQLRLPPAVKTPYKSILGFLPYAKVPSFQLEDAPFFFESEVTHGGFVAYQRLTPNQSVSEAPTISDLENLQQPGNTTVDVLLEEALRLERSYPHREDFAVNDIKVPDYLVKLPTKFDIAKPKLSLRLWPGPLAVLNGFVRAANRQPIAEFRKACQDWRELQIQHEKAVEELHQTSAALHARLASLKERTRAQLRDAQTLREADRAAWENRRRTEIDLLRVTLGSWRAAYLESPAALAKIVLEFTLFPRWLPVDIASTFDAQSGLLIVDLQFPDVGQLTWHRHSGDKLKVATKAQAREANERLYPALALRFAWEIARAANDNLVNTIVLNGWSDYIERTTGATKRAYVTSLLAEITKLRALNLPAVDVVEAFRALKGVSARAQTVTPVAPIVAMDTSDRRFVDPRNVMDGMPSEQNLATMDWGDFEHLCRELFEKEFASSNSEVKITQASRDQGVDAVIFDRDPLRGGKIVIQAKRYTGTVDVSAVRDLWGTTQHEGAMKGILVTTSQYGSDAYNFANGKPLTLINGGQLLHLLERHGYRFRINLAEAKKIARERYAGAKET